MLNYSYMYTLFICSEMQQQDTNTVVVQQPAAPTTVVTTVRQLWHVAASVIINCSYS